VLSEPGITHELLNSYAASATPGEARAL